MRHEIDDDPLEKGIMAGLILALASFGLLAYLGFSAGGWADLIFSPSSLLFVVILVIVGVVTGLLRGRGPTGVIVGFIARTYFFSIAIKMALLFQVPRAGTRFGRLF